MMYIRITNENGTITFAPMTSNNIYVLCKDCGHMVPVEYAEELNWGAEPLENIDLCEECAARRDAAEEEYLAEEQSRKIVSVMGILKERKQVAELEGRTFSEEEMKDIITAATKKVSDNSLVKNDDDE